MGLLKRKRQKRRDGQAVIDTSLANREKTTKRVAAFGTIEVDANTALSLKRRLGALEAAGDLTVVQECLVGALLLLLMFMVYLFTRRITAPKASGSTAMRIVRKKAPVMYKLL